MKLLHFIVREGNAPIKYIIIAAVLSELADILLLATVNHAADQVVGGAIQVRMFVMYLLVFALFVVTQHYSLVHSVAAAESALHRVKLRIADKVRRRDLRFIEKSGGIGTYTPLAKEVALISQGATILVEGAKSGLMLLFAMIYLGLLSPLTLLLTLIILVVAIPLAIFHYQKTVTDLEAASKRESQVFERFTGILEGFKELKLNRNENDSLFAELSSIAQRASHLKLVANERQIRDLLIANGITYLILFSAVFIVPSLVPEYSSTVLKVSAMLLFALGALSSMANSIPFIARVNSSIANLHHLETSLDEDLYAEDSHIGKQLQSFKEINIQSLHFNYTDQHGDSLFQVGPIDLTLHQGELLFIVGGNGSGKSTLLKLLTGLYRPNRGQIILNGKKISSDADYPGFRSLFTSVFTDFALFEHIYGIPNLDSNEVNRHIDDLGLAEKTNYTSSGFTNIDLSTGQRKRLALITSMLKARPICIFDELAADQDPVFRRRFYEVILPDLQAAGRTIVVVSHDDQYFHTADRILRVRDGRLETLEADSNGQLTW